MCGCAPMNDCFGTLHIKLLFPLTQWRRNENSPILQLTMLPALQHFQETLDPEDEELPMTL